MIETKVIEFPVDKSNIEIYILYIEKEIQQHYDEVGRLRKVVERIREGCIHPRKTFIHYSGDDDYGMNRPNKECLVCGKKW